MQDGGKERRKEERRFEREVVSRESRREENQTIICRSLACWGVPNHLAARAYGSNHGC